MSKRSSFHLHDLTQTAQATDWIVAAPVSQGMRLQAKQLLHQCVSILVVLKARIVKANHLQIHITPCTYDVRWGVRVARGQNKLESTKIATRACSRQGVQYPKKNQQFFETRWRSTQWWTTWGQDESDGTPQKNNIPNNKIIPPYGLGGIIYVPQDPGPQDLGQSRRGDL